MFFHMLNGRNNKRDWLQRSCRELSKKSHQFEADLLKILKFQKETEIMKKPTAVQGAQNVMTVFKKNKLNFF